MSTGPPSRKSRKPSRTSMVGIVQGIIKLENVLVHASGHVAVSDFGASKRLAPRQQGL